MRTNLFNKIFYKKEFWAVTESHHRNFWILFIVFLGAIGAIEFSRSGQHYLNHVMDDPFVNWVEVNEQGEFDSFSSYMKSQQERFNISTIENNYYLIGYLYSTESHKIRVIGRTIAPESKLLKSLLDPTANGAITECDVDGILEHDFGWVVTKDLMKRLGYGNPHEYPLFINYAAHDEDLKNMGWNVPIVNKDSNFIGIAIPLIAVVDKLPNMLDFMALQQFCYQQEDQEIAPFRPSRHPEYFKRAQFISEYNIEDTIRNIARKGLFEISEIKEESYYGCLRPAKSYKIQYAGNADIADFNRYNNMLVEALRGKAYRLFEYDDISSVPKFAEEAKDKGVIVDMTQIKAKENITIFNTLITLLCVAILILATVFLAIFIWFLIDSHYKSISKNLGTIMAFGLANKTIIGLYLAIFLTLISSALLSAVMVLGMAEIICRIFELSREAGYYYFVINDPMVIITILCIPVLSTLVIVCTMCAKLKATPGDLILERN